MDDDLKIFCSDVDVSGANYWSINDVCNLFQVYFWHFILDSLLATRYSSFGIDVGLCPFTLSMGYWPNRDVDLGRFSFLFVNEPRLRGDGP